MTFFILLHALAALLAPAIMRAGRRGFLLLAAIPASATLWVLTHVPAVMAGQIRTEKVDWIPSLGITFAFRLDPLAAVMALIVTGVGALVLVYCSPYFARHASALGRFGGVFVAFAGAMFGLVTTDNTLALYIFWEATTVFSFLLIGHHHQRQPSRRAAHQAIIVTTIGGLAMLAGFIMMAALPGGSYQLSTLIARAHNGELAADQPLLLSVCAFLILMGAASKSALIPTHFWLPAAMAAPTPVSAYLHAAAMVKAGVYLVVRLNPGFAHLPIWQATVLTLGLGTMILGGYRALRQYDIKLLLAFGTVSQLGMMIAIVGMPHSGMVLAGLVMIASHALFKSALFLCVGIIDWSYGTRDVRELSGIGRRLPGVAVSAAIAIASMIGLPPFLGYVAKEAALHELVHQTTTGSVTSGVALGIFVFGSILTFAYGLRFWWGAFATKPRLCTAPGHPVGWLIQTSPAILAAGALAGLAPGVVENLLAPIARLSQPRGTVPASVFTATTTPPASLEVSGHLTLWGGVGWPLFLTVLVIGGGTGLFLIRARVERWQAALPHVPNAEESFRRSEQVLENIAAALTSATQRGSLPFYLSTILVTVMGALFFKLVSQAPNIGAVRPYDHIAQIPVAAVTVIAAFMAARARRRLKAVFLLGVSGYGVALIFALHGAPDIALTQVLVETVTLAVFVLVLRRLPAYFSNRPLRTSRYVRAAIGAFTGVVVSLLALAATSARIHTPVSEHFPAEALSFGYGHNIVNVTLVDIRAWDTFGEIAVVLAAATGVASLLFLRARTGIVDRGRNVRSADTRRVWDSRSLDKAETLASAAKEVAVDRARSQVLLQPGRGRTWLAGAQTLAPRRRSVVFEVAARLIFHTMMLLSLYLLFAGHNAPGGGFAGGIMAGTALMVRYLAAGRYELGEALPLHAGHVLGTGLVLSAIAGLLPVFVGGTILQTTVFDFHLPIWGDVHLATALLFDIGVYLLVIGLVLDILRSLGAEIDRHIEIERREDDAPAGTASAVHEANDEALIRDDADHAAQEVAHD